MNPDRYQRITENVYIDRWGTPPAQPPKPGRQGKPRFGIVDALVCLIGLAVVAVVLFPVFARSREGCIRRPTCQTNLKQVALGIVQYMQDYNGQYPLAAVNDADYTTSAPYEQAYGWADAIQPYLKSTYIYICPSGKEQGLTHPDTSWTNKGPNPGEVGFTDYWFNRNLFGMDERKVDNAAETFLSGDGNTGHDATDARYSLSALPARWRDDPRPPARRHLDGLNFCYADGHVKWLSAAKASDPAYNRNSFTLDRATAK